MSISLAIATDHENRFHLVEQFRTTLGRRSWEFPSGDAAPDEQPLRTAGRELREETGLTARTWEPLGSIDVAPGDLGLECHVFWARDLTPGPHQRDPGERDMRCASFSQDDLEAMIGSGDLRDGKSLAAYALLSQYRR